jgi:Uma2 family endonuclease
MHRFSYDQYLAYEADSGSKHEFIDGEIYAMAGGTLRHAVLAANVVTALATALRDKPCVVTGSDLKIRVIETDMTSYPDVTVICGQPELDPKSRDVALNPTLLVEVTSDSTETWDREGKLEHYKKISSLREVLLVSHRKQTIDLIRRGSGGTWSLQTVNSGQVRLEGIDCALLVNDVYRNTDVPT